MGFRSRNNHGHGQIPEINLVPMMDVVMTILIFFVIVSMTLTGESGSVDLTLPSAKEGLSPSNQKTTDPLVVSINPQGNVFIGANGVDDTQLAQQIKGYLSQYPKDGSIVLKADNKLPYEKVIQLLSKMRKVGGERVSLAINQG